MEKIYIFCYFFYIFSSPIDHWGIINVQQTSSSMNLFVNSPNAKAFKSLYCRIVNLNITLTVMNGIIDKKIIICSKYKTVCFNCARYFFSKINLTKISSLFSTPPTKSETTLFTVTKKTWGQAPQIFDYLPPPMPVLDLGFCFKDTSVITVQIP